MKHLLFIALCALLPLYGYSQKIEKDEIDQFNKTRYIRTTELTIAKGKGLAKESIKVFAAKSISNGKTYTGIFLRLVTYGYSPAYEGDGAELLLSNDEVVTIMAGSRSTPYLWGDGYYKVIIDYTINQEDMESLLNNSLKAIRVKCGSDYLTFKEIPEKNKDAIKNVLTIIKDIK